MADNTVETVQISPEEQEEIKKFFAKRNIDLQIRILALNIRKMDDGGLVIDPPKVEYGFVKVKGKNKKETNHITSA